MMNQEPEIIDNSKDHQNLGHIPNKCMTWDKVVDYVVETGKVYISPSGCQIALCKNKTDICIIDYKTCDGKALCPGAAKHYLNINFEF